VTPPGLAPQNDTLFGALVNWVENGKAPEAILVSKPLDGGLTQTRPLCSTQALRYGREPAVLMMQRTSSVGRPATKARSDISHSALEYVTSSRAAAAMLAENYVGLPFD